MKFFPSLLCSLSLVLSSLLCSSASYAQTWDSLCVDTYRIDTADVGVLKAEVNALAFFQNNEFSSKIQKGYTLPGTWLQPKLTFAPLPQVNIEAGAHLLFFDGAGRYPNYAYHDIAQWKGNQHQHGVHALPYFRVQADFRRLTLVLGDIYGAQTHGLVLPLFNPEQNLSADPEMGFQLLLDRSHAHLDLWMNWQSYIFNLDTHQEAFTVGANTTLRWQRNRCLWEVPIQFIVQHRGGELDTTDRGVQTVANGALGARLTYAPSADRVLSALRAEANLLGSWQQHGTLWPFDTGLALHTALRATLWRGLSLELGYVGAPRRFANLYGSPFFGTLSTRNAGMTFDGMHTLYASAGYSYTFARNYHLGAQLDLYSCHSRDVDVLPFGFGLYFRVNPSFVITRKKSR
jgi:hypothetical protein